MEMRVSFKAKNKTKQKLPKVIFYSCGPYISFTHFGQLLLRETYF